MSWYHHAYHAAWLAAFAFVVIEFGWLPVCVIYLLLGFYYFWQA